jgi:hypothetical protein
MRSWSLEKKQLMIHQDTQAELLASQYHQSPPSSLSTPLTSMATNNDHDPSHHPSSFISVLAEKADKVKSTLNKSDGHGHRRWSRYQSGHRSSLPLKTLDDGYNSPEFFIRKFMETNLRAVSVADACNLEFSLRTRPIT